MLDAELQRIKGQVQSVAGGTSQLGGKIHRATYNLCNVYVFMKSFPAFKVTLRRGVSYKVK